MIRSHRDDAGQAIVLVALVMLAMLFAVGLAIDTGQLYNGRRTAQEAADAAAFAGAVVLYQLGSASQARAAAAADATLNGYAANSPTSGTTVTVSLPPTSGSRAGDSACVQVTIATPVRTSLVPQQSSFSTVVARGTGCSLPQTTPYAIVATDQNCDTDTLSLPNNGVLTIHGGSIQVNSCGSKAAENNGTVTLDPGYETDVVGGTNGTSWPTLHTGVAVQADPFAGTPKPSISGLITYGAPACSPSINLPGIYTGSAASNCNYVFAPGTYIFMGSGLQLSGSSANACTGSAVSTSSSTAVPSTGTQTVSVADGTNISVGKMLLIDTGTAQEGVVPSAVAGSTFTAIFAKTHPATWPVTSGCTPPTADGGVFMFFTSSSYPATGGTCASQPIKIEGGVNTVLTAPTSGTYQGMLFWEDSVCTQDVNIGGGGSILTSGSIYAPNATVAGNGSGSTITVSQVVSKVLATQNATFTINFNANLNFNGYVPALVE